MPDSTYAIDVPMRQSNSASTPWFSDVHAGIGQIPPVNSTTQQAQMTNQQVAQLAIGIQSQSGNVQTALTAIKTAILNLPSHA